jgi:hypothetical protein
MGIGPAAGARGALYRAARLEVFALAFVIAYRATKDQPHL